VRLAQVEAQQRELVRLALEPRAEEGDGVARALRVARRPCDFPASFYHEEGGLLYDYKEKRRLERIAKGDYQRKGIPPDRKGKYEL